MATDYSRAGWWARPVAILYTVSLAPILLFPMMVVGTVFGIAGTFLRLADLSDQKVTRAPRTGPVQTPIKRTMAWYYQLLAFSLFGRGEFKFVPEYD
jgi:hypothetical protein